MRVMVKFLSVTQFILFSIMESQSEPFKLVGPAFSLTGTAGQDLVLPCSVQPETSIVDARIEWFRLDASDSLVHLYKDQQEQNNGQISSYKGRTALFRDKLEKGNASLTLSAAQVTDMGIYKCLVEAKTWYDDITVNVSVEVLGVPPVISMDSFDNIGGINLVCASRGWNPEPAVLWLDRKGADLSAEATETHRDTEGFSVKRRLTVHDGDSNIFFCRLQQKHHMMQTEIIITKKVFDAWKTAAISISLLALIATMGVTATVICVCQKKALQGRMKEQEILWKKLEEDFEKEKQYAEIQRKRVEDEFEKKMTYAVEVTLDAETASPKLILSEDGKQVTHEDTKQNLPEKPERFDYCPCVLGKEGFSSGRFYYEVQVKGKIKWDLGVARESVNRKGQISLSPESGFWVVAMRNEIEYNACVGSSVLLSLKEKPQKVGVFVDYEEGLVSFYDVEARSHIYSFTGQTFTEKLYPYFSPCNNKKGQNSDPLIISPMSK